MATIDVTDPAREVLNQAPPLRPINLFEVDLRAARGARARGRRLGRRSRARGRRGRRQRRGASSTGAAPSATCRSCARTTATATGSTRSSSTRRGTGCCEARSSARSRACRGASRSPARTSSARAMFMHVGQRQRRRDVPGVDDLRGDPGAARRRARAGRRVGAAADQARLRRRARWPGWR